MLTWNTRRAGTLTKSELNRRVYLETANAIRFYLAGSSKDQLTEMGPVTNELVRSAAAFEAAAEAIAESQKAGVDP